jgi:hypothetical protein
VVCGSSSNSGVIAVFWNESGGGRRLVVGTVATLGRRLAKLATGWSVVLSRNEWPLILLRVNRDICDSNFKSKGSVLIQKRRNGPQSIGTTVVRSGFTGFEPCDQDVSASLRKENRILLVG